MWGGVEALSEPLHHIVAMSMLWRIGVYMRLACELDAVDRRAGGKGSGAIYERRRILRWQVVSWRAGANVCHM